MIPVLDLAAWKNGDRAGFSHDLGAACRGPGFFLLRNAAIPAAIRAEAFAQARAFFALNDEEKQALSIARSPHNRGYAALGAETLDPTSGQMDRKEAFNIGLGLAADDPQVIAGAPFRGVNLWPNLPGFRSALLAYFQAAAALNATLHQAVARDLGQAEDFFAPHFSAPISTLRLLRYPVATDESGQIGAGEHTDYGNLTLLATDGVPGLQVRPRGGHDWVDVPHVAGTLIVNIGDLLMRWTNGIYASTPHRVLPPPAERFSLAFFADPNPDSVVAALPGTGDPRQPPIKAADYLTQRLNATYDTRDTSA
ncbi:MAG: 2-oxoglutarate and iron-dependent oxygenase domain-containing protein [Pseudomonadota bacterium]